MHRQQTAWEELRPLLDGSYVVLDTETTGLLAPELVSVAVIDHLGETMLHEFVRPAKPIESDASRITGITNDCVADKPPFPTIEPILTSAIAGKLVVIYNAAYDLEVMRNTYARYGLALPEFSLWCAMEWFAHLNGDWNEARGSYVWQSLAKAADYFGVDNPSVHDALADCRTTWRLLQEALRRAGLREAGTEPLF